MKKVLFVLAAAACMVACGNKAEKAEAAAEEVVAEEVVAEEEAVEEVVADSVVVEAAEEVAE